MRRNCTTTKVCLLLLVLITVSCKEAPTEVADHDFLNKPTSDNSAQPVDDYTDYDMSELEDRLILEGLVDVQALDSTIQLDLKYSTLDNFLKIDLYEDYNACYLQAEVADKLVLAQMILRSRYPSYSLKVFDAVRPRSVQWKMWKSLNMPDKEKTKYVSNPRFGSLHNFGAAVDLTIVNEFGSELNMGTNYDHFGELAYPRKEEELLKSGELTEEQYAHRILLREVMEMGGFRPISTEWWHFNSCLRSDARIKYKIVE